MTAYSIFRKSYENKTLVIITIFAMSFLFSHKAVVISEIIIALSFLPRLFINSYAERIIDKKLKEIFELWISPMIIGSTIFLLTPFFLVNLLSLMNQSNVLTNDLLFPDGFLLAFNTFSQWLFPIMISLVAWVPIIDFWVKNRKHVHEAIEYK